MYTSSWHSVKLITVKGKNEVTVKMKGFNLPPVNFIVNMKEFVDVI